MSPSTTACAPPPDERPAVGLLKNMNRSSLRLTPEMNRADCDASGWRIVGEAGNESLRPATKVEGERQRTRRAVRMTPATADEYGGQ